MNSLQKKNYYYLLGILLYSSLIIGFIFNENLTGGAQNDYIAHKEIIYKFSINFFKSGILIFSNDLKELFPAI